MTLRNSPALLGTVLFHLGVLTLGLNWANSKYMSPGAAKGQQISLRIVPTPAPVQQKPERRTQGSTDPASPHARSRITERPSETRPPLALSAGSASTVLPRHAIDSEAPTQAKLALPLAPSQGREPPASTAPAIATAAPSPIPAMVQASLAPEHQPCLAQVTERYYPSMLRDRGLQALVTLLVHVDEQGRAAEIKLKQGSGLRLFDEAAHQVARACRFTPARLGEQAIASWVEYPVRFALKAARQ